MLYSISMHNFAKEESFLGDSSPPTLPIACVRSQEDVRDVESIVPVNSFSLAWWNFAREYRALRRTFRFGEFKNTWIAGPFALIDRFLET